MLTILIRTALIYLIVVAAVRLMGKRQVSDMQTSELVVTLMISEVASLPLENADRPLAASIVPILMLAGVEILLSLLMMKSRKARDIICGHPVVIIRDGQFIDGEMHRLRITREDVYSLLRQQNHPDPSGVRFGIIEPNGSLSILETKDLTCDGVESKELADALKIAEKNGAPSSQNSASASQNTPQGGEAS
jgi:uncharacterized membrane protein YcaP (DUF421 family)